MTRVVRFVADPLLPARECAQLQDIWWDLAVAAVRARGTGLTDLARHYALRCRNLIAAVGKPTTRLSFPDVPSRSVAA